MGWTKKELWLAFLVTLTFLFIGMVALEIGLAILRPSPVQPDRLLGWRLKENFQRQFPQSTLGGKNYLASFRTNESGLRTFGGSGRAPVTVLVLGDSFTADPYASNDRMWYASMTERLAKRTQRPSRDFQVLAGGAGGWGTYQNFLLAQSLSRTAKPDLFVLQFCSNDFQNNSYEWESQGVARGQYMRRPFASIGTQLPMYASGIAGAIYRSWLGQSRLLNKIDGLVGGMQLKSQGGYIRPLPPDVAAAYERNSLALTKMLLVKLRRTFEGTPAAVMVNCDGNETGPNRFWKSLAREAGFIPVSAPSDFLRSLNPSQRADYLHADGSHLSEDGNQAYGAVAGDAIASLNLTPLHRK